MDRDESDRIESNGTGTEKTESNSISIERAFSRLSMYDPGMDLRTLDGEMTESVILELMRRESALGVAIGTRYETWSRAIHLPGEPVFHPLVGMEEEEIQSLASSMEDFHRTFTVSTGQEEDV